MSDNQRFHSRFHRFSHHTNATPGYPDSALDPIASSTSPFKGDFYVDGVVRATNILLGLVDVLAKVAELDNHVANTSNPHNVTAAQLGLDTVTGDISSIQSAINAINATLATSPWLVDMPTIWRISDESQLTTLSSARPNDYAMVGDPSTDYKFYVLIKDINPVNVPNSYANVNNWPLLEDSAITESVATLSTNLTALEDTVTALSATVATIQSTFVKADGSIAMTGDLNINNNNVVNTVDVNVLDVITNNPTNPAGLTFKVNNALSVNSYINDAYGDSSTGLAITYRENPATPGVWAWMDDSNTVLTTNSDWNISGTTMTLLVPVKVGFIYLENNAILKSYADGSIARSVVHQKARQFIAWKTGDTVTFSGIFDAPDYKAVANFGSL